jgi:CzcA family heavy metal efflux pump
MLSWLIGTSVRARVVVLALCGLLMIYGFRTVRTAPLDVFPEFAPPKVEIQTEAPGLATEEVESLITVPLENALNGTPGMQTLRSKSVLGLSSVVLLFAEGTDLHKARQYVQERVAAEAVRLPAVARSPVILQPLSSLSRVMKIGISSETLSQRELSVLALWTIRPKLMSVPGVANVAIWGQRDKQFQVLVDPDRLRAAGVSLDQVLRAAGDATVLDSGGFVDTPNQRLAVRHRSQIHDPDDLKNMVVDFRGGAPIRLGDVAELVIGSPPPIGDAIINDVPGLLLIVEKQPEGNTLEVSRKVEAALADLAPGLTGVQVDATIFRPATFIERAIENLSQALLIGCALVIVILVAFLFDWRTALISLTAIPLSLVSAVVVLTALGFSLNTMVIAGLVIALGEVVDDAIIDVENIHRRLSLASHQSASSAFQIVLEASLEVRSAVVYATLIVIIVFLPIFFLDGIAGAFFRPLALAYILAILASLVVALTVTPALSYMLLTGRRPRRSEAPLAGLLRRLYGAVLPFLIHRPYAAFLFILGTFVLSGAAATRFGQEFLPEFQETDFLMHFLEKPGCSIAEMDRMTVLASKELRAIPGVRNFGSHIGRAEVADEVVGPNFTELWISIEPDVDYPSTLKRIQHAMDGYPGMYVDVQTYLKERSKEVLSGTSASIVVRIFGPDLPVLRKKAKEVEAAMAKVAGVTNLKVEAQVLVPQIEVRLRPDAAQRYGLTAGHVRRAATTLLRGTKVGEVFESQKRFDVVVWGVPRLRTDLTALQELPIDTPAGMQVRLKDVAEVLIVPMPNEIKREAASRRLDVTCNVKDRDLGAVATEIERNVRELAFDQGYHPEFLGEYQARQESTRRLC